MLGYFILFILNNIFFYEDPLFIFFGFTIALIGYFWPFILSSTSRNYFFAFLLGIYCYFNIGLILIILLVFPIFSLIFNHVFLGYLITFFMCFTSIYFFELNDFFIISNSIFIALYVIRHAKEFIYFFSENTNTLMSQFRFRND
mgnify:CR=1 FL=1